MPQTRAQQYNMTQTTPPPTNKMPTTSGPPLQITHPSIKSGPNIPGQTLIQMEHNPHVKAPHNYSVVDDLAQFIVSMSTLEVLQTFLSKKKSLLNTMGAINLLNSRIMTFDLDHSTPIFPSSMDFQIPVTIKNISFIVVLLTKVHPDA